jgi:sugar phosphate isomerase/epimerase
MTVTNMIVALHTAPNGFFKSRRPHTENELLSLVRKAASLGFTCFQVGPLSDFVDIDGKRLRRVLAQYGMKTNVHVGGLYDAEEFAKTGEEYRRAQKEIHRGIELCREINSKLVSFHPPFFTKKDIDKKLVSRARERFLRLVGKESEFAYNNGIKMALESFCYSPFIFKGLRDFMEFISCFPSVKIGVLLEVGHLYQAGFNLDEVTKVFKGRLLDVHVHDATLQEDFRRATHLPIGEGSINSSHVVNILRECKYDGWLTLEIHGSEEDIIESKQLLENIIKNTA